MKLPTEPFRAFMTSLKKNKTDRKVSSRKFMKAVGRLNPKRILINHFTCIKKNVVPTSFQTSQSVCYPACVLSVIVLLNVTYPKNADVDVIVLCRCAYVVMTVNS